MNGPWRHPSHIRETASFKAIGNCFPDSWEQRYLTGRDYGVDCIFEMAEHEDGKVRMPGALFSVQAKGVGRLKWRRDGVARIHGIKASTVNYWMMLPMPVFLCVHEAHSGNVYFTDVKSYARRHYDELLGARSFAFEVDKKLPLDTEAGLANLVLQFLREMAFPEFSFSLKYLLTQEDAFKTFQTQQHAKQASDESDELTVARMMMLMNACIHVADYLGLAWKGPTFEAVLEYDQGRPLASGTSEGAVAWTLNALDVHYRQLVKAGRQLVTEVERPFWVTGDPVLVRGCYSSEQRARMKELRESDEVKRLEARLVRAMQRRRQEQP